MKKNPFVMKEPLSLRDSGSFPLEVSVIRGNTLESVHKVHGMILQKGKPTQTWGDPGLIFFPRSAVKPIQALPFMVAGLQKKWNLGSKELSLACASHYGEAFHVNTVKSWLEKMGLSEGDLECGAQPPYDEPSLFTLVRQGESPCRIHNNCSGKHTGMLMGCLGMGFSTKGYSEYDHPYQEKVREYFSLFFGQDMKACAWGVDGCGIPAYAVSLRALAHASMLLADPSSLDSHIQEAVRSLNGAIRERPEYFGGSDSFCTKVVRSTGGRVLAKVGAEGVYAAWVEESGVGIALKCEDGSFRAVETALAAVLSSLGFSSLHDEHLMKNWAGEVVGQLLCH